MVNILIFNLVENENCKLICLIFRKECLIIVSVLYGDQLMFCSYDNVYATLCIHSINLKEKISVLHTVTHISTCSLPHIDAFHIRKVNETVLSSLFF